jgi:uncharacterized membrane protein YqjE
MTVAHLPHPATAADPGIAGLLQRLRSDALELLRAELTLARAELILAVSKLICGAMLGLIGTVLMLAGVLALLAAAIIVLNFWLPLWMAACAVGIVLLCAGMLVSHAARQQLDAHALTLTHTTHSIQEDLELLKRKAHEPAKPQRNEPTHDLRVGGAHRAVAGPR